MISELNDDEILDFLMTSDFEEDYKPSEFKYFLIKWRYFYRLLYGRLENIKTNNTYELNKLTEDLTSVKNSLSIEQFESVKKTDTINSMKCRKLTLKERITGKIILKDENK